MVDDLAWIVSSVKGMNENEKVIEATSFFYENYERMFLVMNKHVIYGDNYSKEDVKPKINSLVLKIHTNQNDLHENKEIRINLFDESGEKLWLEHKDKNVDIVLVPILEPPYMFIKALNNDYLDYSKLVIEKAERILVSGFALGLHDNFHNLPVTKSGYLISDFGFGFNDSKFMLGEVNVHDGMHGSPVFFKIQNPIINDGNKKVTKLGKTALRLCGVFSSNFIFNNKKSNIIVIWFPWLIEEILVQNLRYMPLPRI